MSTYTIQLRYICEHLCGLDESMGYANVNDIINGATPKIFNFDWPIFDEKYREPLERKIIRHFYTREIGLETVSLWQLKLQTKLNEIMPYYNKLYESELIKFNPMHDTDVTTQHNRKDYGDSKQHVDSNTHTEAETHQTDDATTVTDTNRTDVTDTTEKQKFHETRNDNLAHKDRYSDTPQNGLFDTDNQRYLTNYRYITDINEYETDSTTDTTRNETTESEQHQNQKYDNQTDVTAESTQDFTQDMNQDYRDTQDFIETIVGKRSGTSFSKFLEEWRKTFLNIDMMIINELEPLFMGIW